MRLRERFRRLTLWNKLGAVGAIASIVGVPLGILYFVFSQPRDAANATPTVEQPPDVGLAFYRPKAPQFRIVNLSSVVVREPKYQFLLYDVDLPGTHQPYLNLWIPTALLDDYIRPHASLGPWGLTSLSARGSRVQPGHNLLGYAQVQCPDCVEFRKYWLYIKVGETGWYAEIPEPEHLQIGPLLARVIHGSGSPVEALDQIVPRERRITIR